MTRKLLSWLGAFAVVTLCSAAATGLLLVQDRLRIVVQADGTADATAQDLATLRDEVAQVHRDVGALAESLGRGLQQFAAEQEVAATQRATGLQGRLDGTVAEVRARLDGALTELRQLVIAAAEHPPTAPSVAAGAILQPGETQPGPAPVVSAPARATPEPAPPVMEPPGESSPATIPARKPSAFAFRLPSQTFVFDGTQRYELLPRLSRVGFDAKSTLHDFTGVTSSLAGALRLNLAAPELLCTGSIRVDARTLDTGLAGRNDAMREHLATQEHPQITFTCSGMSHCTVDTAAQIVVGTVHGTMTIRGASKEIAMPVRLQVDASKRVHADGEVMLKLTDYGVPVPSQLGMIGMQDEVKVWIALQARALADAGQAVGRGAPR